MHNSVDMMMESNLPQSDQIKFLLKTKNCDIDKIINNEKMDTQEVFLQAAGYGMLDAMEKIFSTQKVDINFYSKESDGTPLIWAAASGSSKAIIWLLDHGADINLKSSNPNHAVFPLWVAAQDGIMNCVHILCERGALVNEVNAIGNTPLSIASQNGHFFVIQELLRYGADPTLSARDVVDDLLKQDAMTISLLHGKIEVVALLLSYGVSYDPFVTEFLINDMESSKSKKLIKVITQNGLEEIEIKIDISTVEKLRDLMPFITRDRPWGNALKDYDEDLEKVEFEIRDFIKSNLNEIYKLEQKIFKKS